jgi:hypothetical protein
MADQADKKPVLRIGVLTSFLMVGLALIYDGLQALVEVVSLGFLGWLINPLIDFWAFLTFFTWFTLKGAGFVKPGKAITLGSSSFLEMIPYFNDLPVWTAGVIIMIAQTDAEDVVGKISPTATKALGKVLNPKKLNA